MVLENLPVIGTIVVSFADVRDTIEAVRALRVLGWDWLFEYCSVPKLPVDSEQNDWKDLLPPKDEDQLLSTSPMSVISLNKAVKPYLEPARREAQIQK